MILLNFDTALNKTYVTLSQNGEIKNSKIISNTEDNYHSAYLISTIKEILKTNNLTPKDVDYLAVNIGPGSFTGIRAALTVAKVYAEELNIKIIPVESLKILAELNETNKKTLVSMDARRNMAYYYTKDNDKIKIVSYDKLKEIAKNEDFQIICDKNISELLNNKEAIIYEEQDIDLGKILNKIANKTTDKAVTGIELKALYIQSAPVFVKK